MYGTSTSSPVSSSTQTSRIRFLVWGGTGFFETSSTSFLSLQESKLAVSKLFEKVAEGGGLYTSGVTCLVISSAGRSFRIAG